MSGAIDGVCNAPFFGSSKTDEGYQRRLRAVVQNILTDFSERVRKEGRSLNIVESTLEEVEGDLPSGQRISREEYLDEVKKMMRRNRGCELPGTFNPLIIGELFNEQCQPWRGLAESLSEDVLEAVHQTTAAILDHVAVPEVVGAILQILNLAIEKLRDNCKSKVAELLTPHNAGHPITYNHYLTDQVQKAQAERQKKALEALVKKQVDTVAFSPGKTYALDAGRYTDILNTMVRVAMTVSSEADMERQAASLAVDYMQAYYKVSILKWRTRMPRHHLVYCC